MFLSKTFKGRVVMKSFIPRNRTFFPTNFSHNESPLQTGLIRRNSYDATTSANNNISIWQGACQVENAEPAEEIAQGSSGVCNGQG
jgi:hypothetical protein